VDDAAIFNAPGTNPAVTLAGPSPSAACSSVPQPCIP
jgi:hypothetical protein